MNPAPSREVTLRHAASAVLKSSFGKFWPVYMLVIFGVVLGPAYIFRHEIRLEPAEFVTEWLKLSIEGVLIFFILEIVRHRSLSATARGLLLNYLTATYILPLQESLNSLKSFRESLEGGDQTESARSITSARNNWRLIENALSGAFLSRIPGEAETSSKLLRSREALKPDRCNNIMRSLSNVRDPERLHRADFDELVGLLENFLRDVKSL